MTWAFKNLDTGQFYRESVSLKEWERLWDDRSVSGNRPADQLLIDGIYEVRVTVPDYDPRVKKINGYADTEQPTHIDRLYSIIDHELNTAKDLCRDSLVELYRAKLNQGVQVGGAVYGTDADSQARLNFMALGITVDSEFSLAPPVRPYPFVLFTREGEAQVMDNAGEFVVVYRAYHDHETACTTRGLQLDQSIRNATSIAELETILADFDNGWPAVP